MSSHHLSSGSSPGASASPLLNRSGQRGERLGPAMDGLRTPRGPAHPRGDRALEYERKIGGPETAWSSPFGDHRPAVGEFYGLRPDVD